LLTSPHDGERLAAAARFTAILEAHDIHPSQVLANGNGPALTEEQMSRIYAEGYRRGAAETEQRLRPQRDWTPADDTKAELGSDAERLEAILRAAAQSRDAGLLSDWEVSFSDDMRERFEKYGDRMYVSEKQWAALDRLETKSIRPFSMMLGQTVKGKMMPIPGMTGGDQKPIIKYNAKAAKWKVDDVLLNSLSFIIDMDNIEAGWCKFTEGSAPDFKMVKVADLLNGTNYPESPGENYRKGFRAMVKVSDKVAGGKPSVRVVECSLADVRHQNGISSSRSSKSSITSGASGTSVTCAGAVCMSAVRSTHLTRTNVRRGLAVLPLYGVKNGRCTCGKDCGRSAGKHPHRQLVRNGVSGASCDPEQIGRWFRAYPEGELNIGLAMGEVVAIDEDQNGAILAAGLELPNCPTARTSRGHHYLFRANGAGLANVVFAPGLQLKMQRRVHRRAAECAPVREEVRVGRRPRPRGRAARAAARSDRLDGRRGACQRQRRGQGRCARPVRQSRPGEGVPGHRGGRSDRRWRAVAATRLADHRQRDRPHA
jgi:hypothetical protein